MKISESYIRSTLRQVGEPNEVFSHENAFLTNENGAIIGLNLTNTDLSDLSELLPFKELKFLDLSTNVIVDATALGQLKQLEKIDLAFNRIDDLTFTSHLPHLVFLDVRSNRVSRLPYSMARIPIPVMWDYKFQQHGVFLEGNPLEVPPMEVIRRGQDDIRAYLSSLEGGEQPLGELKLIVIGGGRAGKTSLVRLMCGEAFRADEAVTQGINLRLRVASPIDNIRLHIWDFGGQELMYSAHSFFLTRRAVYLIVLDGRREEKAEYWLKQIEIVAGACPVFVIVNKVDENPFYDLNRAELRRKWPNIEGFFSLSCKTEEGLPQFLDSFWSRVGEYELPQLIFSKQWLTIKDQLLSCPQPLVDYSWYLEKCVECAVFDPEQQRVLLNCLNDLGLILHFPGFLLGDLMVLNPPWLTAGIYSLINDEEGKKQGGILKSSDVEQSLRRVGGDLHYAREERRFIIDLMKQFEICFQLDRDRLLIPDLLSRVEPDLPVTVGTRAHLVFLFDFLPLSVFHRVVVRLRADIKDGLLWRTGVVLFDTTLDSTVVARMDEQESRLSVEASGKGRREYLTFVRKVIRDVIKSSGRIAASEHIRLPGVTEYLVPYAELAGLQEMGIEQYVHGVSRRSFRIADLLDSIEVGWGSSESGSAKAEALNAADDPYCFVAYASPDRGFVDSIAEKLGTLGVSLWYDQRLLAGDNWLDIIEKKILNCAVFIIVVSPDSYQAEFVRKEIALALNHNKPLIPIQLRPVTTWLEIATAHWLHAGEETKMLRELYASVIHHIEVKSGQ
jgi:GTPase SAR1 family protein